MPSCYAIGAAKALIQAALRARFSRGKGFIPKPSKSLFYCVTNPQQRSDEAIALGAGLGIWGVINLLEGYGNDNPGAKSQGMKQLMAGGGVALVGMLLVPLLSGLFS